jgi:hypothetical protein
MLAHQIEVHFLEGQKFLTLNLGYLQNQNLLNTGKHFIVYIGFRLGPEEIPIMGFH